MSRRSHSAIAITLVAATLWPVAASASPTYAGTYIGSFKGIVISGSDVTSDVSGACGCSSSIDLAGQLIDVSFTTSGRDPSVITNFNGNSSALAFAGNSAFSVFVNAIDPFSHQSGTIDFTGDRYAGSFVAGVGDYDDSGSSIIFNYSGAGTHDGPVSGSGSAAFSNNNSFSGGADRFLNFSFDLISGTVQAVGVPAVPEPATWALMIAGFGMVGAAMRRGQRLSVRYA